MARPREIPSRARIVIIGGGVGGASIAYHLAQLGERDVVLLERNELTSGSTFHSAGLVGQLRGSVSLTRMMMDSVELYGRLDCGWVQCGGIRLACTEEREQEVMRQVAWAKTFGLPLELISPAQAQELFPLMATDGVRCASYLPTDGYLDPSQLTYALVDGARQGGHGVFTQTRVEAIVVSDGRVRGVKTQWGEIEAEVVVNAGGMFAAELGRMAGVRVPVIPFAHEYLVTQPFRERTPGEHLPTLRDPDLLIYFREEGAGLVMGGYERQSAPWSLDDHLVDRIPADFNGRLLEEDWPRFEEIAANSVRRVPAMEDVKVTRLINGPEAFTPDNEFCLGETEVAGLFVAAGFCAHGLAGAGGIGRVMAEWIIAGEPALDVWEMDIRRFGAQYRSPRYTLARAKEVYETYYDIRYPGHERQAGRPLRTSSAYAWHERHGAAFGEKSGWERVNWYQSNAAAGDASLRPRGWAGMHWSPAIGAEVLATRERAGLFDESSFAKLEVSGPGAAELLRKLCDNDVAREVGAITYTQMLNRRGGIECDFTVTRVDEAAVPNRHRNCVWQPRCELDPSSPSARRLCAPDRRDLAVGVLRTVGSQGRRNPRAVDARPARLSLHVDARVGDRGRSGPGAPGHVRRRARMGALLPDRVRRRSLADAVGGGQGSRVGGRGLPRDRLYAAREGLPSVERRHHPR